MAWFSSSILWLWFQRQTADGVEREREREVRGARKKESILRVLRIVVAYSTVVVYISSMHFFN
jgi:hypothetical protein